MTDDKRNGLEHVWGFEERKQCANIHKFDRKLISMFVIRQAVSLQKK